MNTGSASMMEDSDKIGHLGDLGEKPVEELKLLLARQTKLLSNKKFVNSLKDKGEKIRKLVERIETALKQKEQVEATIKQFGNLQLSASGNSVRDDILDATLSQLVNVPLEQAKIVVKERIDHDMECNNIDSPVKEEVQEKERFVPARVVKTKSVQELLSSGKIMSPSAASPHSPASRIAETDITDSEKDKTAITVSAPESMESTTNIQVKDATASQGVSSRTCETSQTEETRQECSTNPPGKPKLKFKYDANLEDAVSPRIYKYNTVKLVDMEESFHLLQDQEKKQRELKAKQDASKLLSQTLHIKMDSYEPEGQLTYRTPVVTFAGDDEDDDDDDQNNDLDYPD